MCLYIFIGHMLTCKGDSEPPLELFWLDANEVCIDHECTLCVDAQMHIEANDCTFVDKCKHHP